MRRAGLGRVPASRVDRVATEPCEVGESPVWLADLGCAAWVDIPAGRVHRLELASGAACSAALPPPVSSIAPADEGRLVVALRDRVVLCPAAAPDRDHERLADVPLPDASARLNDGKCDPWGAYWFGGMSPERPRASALYRVRRGELRRALTGVTISNGLGWSFDGERMYYADSAARTLDRLSVDGATGEVTGREQVAAFADGLPDGIAVDADDCVWVALWGGGGLRRITPNGEVDRVVEIPAPKVTSCAFVGARLDRLLVTTAYEGMTERERRADPLPGSVFLVDVGVRGAAVGRYVP